MEVQKILWPTDLSGNAEKALPHVNSLSQKYQTEIHILYVIEELGIHEPWYGDFDSNHIEKIHEWEEKKARERLDKVCEEYLKGCPLYIKHVAIGDPAMEILNLISEENIEKIRAYLENKPEWQLDIFNVCLWTGARRDEVFNIKKQSLYVDNIKGEKVPFVRLIGKGKRVRNMPLCVEACELLDRRVKYLTDPAKQFELKDRSKSPTQQNTRVESRLKQGYLFWEIIDSHSITKAFARAT